MGSLNPAPRRVSLAPIKRIVVPATFHKNGGYSQTPAVFELGEGSCGLTVSKLEAATDPAGAFAVFQTCTDGSEKTFIYPFFQLTGRIEIER